MKFLLISPIQNGVNEVGVILDSVYYFEDKVSQIYE